MSGTEPSLEPGSEGPTVQGVPWTGRDTLLAMISGVALTVVFIVLAVVVAVATGRGEPRDLAGPGWVAGLTVALYLALCITVWYFALRKHRAPWSAIGLRPATAGQMLAMIPLGIGVLIVNLVVVALLSLIFTDVSGVQQEAFAPGGSMSTQQYLLLLLTVAVVAPIAEEFIFRGMLFGYLRGKMRVAMAIALSSFVFALAHLLPMLVAPLFFVGVVLAVVVERTGSLYPAMFLHAVNNGFALTAIYLASNRV
ncbi:MAG: CPBP family intramembrane metalloprotease [Actinomycetota bacterium]|nr:CPBP family intramembrane metalloprotease [Actinomycetota bacterium]